MIEGWRRVLFQVLLVLLVLGTVFLLLSRFSSNGGDPLFDPINNPHIRVAEDSRIFH